MKKKKRILACLMILGISLTGCSQTGEEQKKEETVFDKVGALYEEKIKGYESIDFLMDEATDTTYTYKYALAHMNDDDIPELLIEKNDTYSGVGYSKVFYYDETSNQLLSPEETIPAGVAGAGGFRGGIAASNKKDGLLCYQGSSGTGEFTLMRLNLEVKDGVAVLKTTTLKDFTLGLDQDVYDGEEIEILWYEMKDLSALEDLKKGTLDLTKVPKKQEEVQEAVVDNITVFEGTLNYLSYNEVLALQGIEDPNGGFVDPNEQYAILVFDQDVTLTATSGDGQGSYTNAAKMIKLDSFTEGEAYNGKRIKVKITDMYWPSDTGLPLGEPYAIQGAYEIIE